jgi:hypothetical protein
MTVQRAGQGRKVRRVALSGPSSKGNPAMAKGMNKRKEVKKPKKETAKPAVSVASTNARVTISPGKPKD